MNTEYFCYGEIKIRNFIYNERPKAPPCEGFGEADLKPLLVRGLGRLT
jgi:hypothetical protein